MENNNILDRVGRRTGMDVPAGYFADFNRRMAASLPEAPWEQAAPQRRSLWQIVRPYVYLAAMFAGIWLMMNIFGNVTTPSLPGVESNPVLAQALDSETFIPDYLLDESQGDEVLDYMWEE